MRIELAEGDIAAGADDRARERVAARDRGNADPGSAAEEGLFTHRVAATGKGEEER
jgi:hypothetical protein